MEKSITCINCPMGCQLTVELENESVVSVKGNICSKGVTYAQLECTNPTRTVTSTVRMNGSDIKMLPVKTKTAVPKDKITACMDALKNISVNAPIHVGDIIVQNVADLGIDIVATRTVL